MKNLICMHCNKNLSKGQIKRANKYCSSECWTVAIYGLSHKRFIDCAYCGEAFKQNKDKIKFCSRICFKNSRKDSGISTEWRSLLVWADCYNCGKSYIKSNARKFCSDQCRKKAYRRSEICFVSCLSCGILHTSRPTRKKQTCKSCILKLRYQKQLETRKAVRVFARQRVKVIDYICVRDKWKCHICGSLVARGKFDSSNPRSKTLDHIVPQSAGGSHDVSNLKLAHFLCNTRRSDRGGNEQLMMIG